MKVQDPPCSPHTSLLWIDPLGVVGLATVAIAAAAHGSSGKSPSPGTSGSRMGEGRWLPARCGVLKGGGGAIGADVDVAPMDAIGDDVDVAPTPPLQNRCSRSADDMFTAVRAPPSELALKRVQVEVNLVTCDLKQKEMGVVIVLKAATSIDVARSGR